MKSKIQGCPLCGTKDYTVVGRFEINALVDSWIKRKNFNPIPDIYKDDFLEKRFCNSCGLYFYNFHISDSEELYQKLQESSDYYPVSKIAYQMAVETIKDSKANNLLEVGSGNGSFLELARYIVPKVVGSEYNKNAAKLCCDRGLEVLAQDAFQTSEQFDVICHFEVLEHIFDTKSFIQEILRLLRKGGKLIISVPDPKGIAFASESNPLLFPPHHQFDFSRATFDWLANKFALKMVEYKEVLDERLYARQFVVFEKE